MIHIALLRGINVGGKNKLPMKDLTAMFEASGCTEVRSYIQSGNVIYEATRACAARVPSAVAKAIADRFGYRVPVITRTADELAKVIDASPFLPSDAPLHVAFLAEKPAGKAIAELDPKRSPPDAFAVVGREIYLSLPNGAGKTKLTNDYFDRTLRTTSTVRNWNTVQKLVELAC